MNLKIYKCKKCNNEFIIINAHSNCCIYCKSEDIKIETDTNKYSLYDNSTQILVE